MRMRSLINLFHCLHPVYAMYPLYLNFKSLELLFKWIIPLTWKIFLVYSFFIFHHYIFNVLFLFLSKITFNTYVYFKKRKAFFSSLSLAFLQYIFGKYGLTLLVIFSRFFNFSIYNKFEPPILVNSFMAYFLHLYFTFATQFSRILSADNLTASKYIFLLGSWRQDREIDRSIVVGITR